jgi:AcrR family transcriptional regulator
MKEDKPSKKLPLQERSKQTVDAIIGAAAHILKKQGPEKFSTNSIADKAGVSIGSIYQFFKNKDGISDELINRLLDKNLKKIEEILNQETEVKEGEVLIYKIGSSLFDSFEQEGPLTTFIMENVLKILGFKRFARLEDRMIPFFLEQIKKKNLPFHHNNPELVLRNAIQCVRVLVLSYFLSPERYPKEEMLREMSRLVAGYLFNPINHLPSIHSTQM